MARRQKGQFFKPPHNIIGQYANYCDNYSAFDLYRGSTKRDVLFFAADAYSPGLELALKTFRASGCQARILLFISPIFYLPSRVLPFMNELGVEFIHNCSETKGRKYVPHMLRFESEYEWLQSHHNEVDRIFHSDAFDVLFQKDPFSFEIKKDRLLFITEPHSFRSCGWNSAWIKHCYGESAIEYMSPHYIVCSGSIIGGSKPYLDLLDLMINSKVWSTCYDVSLDQPILNHILWNGTIKEHGIKYDMTCCDGNFITMQWCTRDKFIPINSKGQLVSLGGSIPAFVHQYNRYENLTLKWYLQCHVQPVPFNYCHSS